MPVCFFTFFCGYQVSLSTSLHRTFRSCLGYVAAHGGIVGRREAGGRLYSSRHYGRSLRAKPHLWCSCKGNNRSIPCGGLSFFGVLCRCVGDFLSMFPFPLSPFSDFFFRSHRTYVVSDTSAYASAVLNLGRYSNMHLECLGRLSRKLNKNEVVLHNVDTVRSERRNEKMCDSWPLLSVPLLQVIKGLRKHTKALLDAHLMVSHPAQWVDDMAAAGVDRCAGFMLLLCDTLLFSDSHKHGCQINCYDCPAVD